MTRHRLDYLIVGHVTQDRMPEGGFTVGGTAAYAARTAKALGGQRRAEEELGWNRGTIRKGMHELESGIRCEDAMV